MLLGLFDLELIFNFLDVFCKWVLCGWGLFLFGVFIEELLEVLVIMCGGDLFIGEIVLLDFV